MAPVLSKMGLLTTAKASSVDAVNQMMPRFQLPFLWQGVKQWANQNALPNWLQEKLWMHNLQKDIDFQYSKYKQKPQNISKLSSA